MMVKVCGITNREDAIAAVEGGASAIGFNFYPKSPRYVTPEKAAEIGESLPAGVLKVGVVVGRIDSRERLPVDVLQVHASKTLPEGRVWKALRVDETFQLSDLDLWPAEAFLLDSPSDQLYGGTGHTFDWSRAAGSDKRIILAGGLDASNVRRAIETARPWGVDACSRIERSPGKKDHVKMAEFLKAALYDF
jgi:phosphoribosylanthranilate isomerase